jgi:hypothetical protein
MRPAARPGQEHASSKQQLPQVLDGVRKLKTVSNDKLLTESNVADRFAEQAENRLRYCHDAGT